MHVCMFVYYWWSFKVHYINFFLKFQIHFREGIIVCVAFGDYIQRRQITNMLWVLSHFSCVWLFVTPWIVVHQAPQSMGFSRKEYWGELPWPPSGDLSHPGIKPTSLTSPVLAGGFFTTCATYEAPNKLLLLLKLKTIYKEPF